MSDYIVKIIKDSDGSIEQSLGPMTKQKADKVFDGLVQVVNHDEYSVGIYVQELKRKD